MLQCWLSIYTERIQIRLVHHHLRHGDATVRAGGRPTFSCHWRLKNDTPTIGLQNEVLPKTVSISSLVSLARTPGLAFHSGLCTHHWHVTVKHSGKGSQTLHQRCGRPAATERVAASPVERCTQPHLHCHLLLPQREQNHPRRNVNTLALTPFLVHQVHCHAH